MTIANRTGVDPVDFLELDALLTDDERLIRDTVRAFVRDRVNPDIAQWFEQGRFPRELIKECADLGLLGMHLEGTDARERAPSRTDSRVPSSRPGIAGCAAS